MILTRIIAGHTDGDMMRAALRQTINRHTGEFRYLDPVTAQVYQAAFLFALSLSLLITELMVKFGIETPAMRWLWSRWRDPDAWSAIGGVLAILLFLAPTRSKIAQLLMLCACCYWFAITGRIIVVIGWTPIAGSCGLVLAVLAAWGYVRATTNLKGVS